MPEGRHAVRRARCRAVLVCAGALAASSCAGPQSALVTAGREAERIAGLWWWLAGGATVIWLAMAALLLVAITRREDRDDSPAPLMVIGGGVVIPTLVLTGVLAYALSILPDMTARASSASLRIDVSGEEWWWRVRYVGAAGAVVETANEIRLPVGERAGFTLTSPDVIHALWIPSLGGKRDMIPGRVNHMVLEPTRTGTFRGVCAEYCGTSHAHMSLDVEVMEAAAFDAWLAEQARDAEPPTDPLAVRGQEVFLANGCGACHAVRGTPADGGVGPDLTHVGSRPSLAAATLPNDTSTLRRWIADPNAFKPEARMPAFGMLPDADLRALSVYLAGLR